ncbi:MAG TPA: hypothetical protein VNK43_07850 [Gemmatimonadales bacterium]|nr:hypothetical protein [Gemmatimonadales bacterium]
MSKKKARSRTPSSPSTFDQARDELFSHILRCGVTEASPEHQKDWFDDTMQYLAERYPELNEEALAQLRVLGERFSRPVVRKAVPTAPAEASHEPVETGAA